MRETTIKYFLEISEKTCGECRTICSEMTRLVCMEAFVKYASMKSTHHEITGSIKIRSSNSRKIWTLQ